MIIQDEGVQTPKKSKKENVPKKKGKAPAKKSKKGKDTTGSTTGRKNMIVSVQTNNREKLVDAEIMKPHNFMTATESTLTRTYPMAHLSGKKYEVDKDESHVSTILKLVMGVTQTNELSEMWSLILWNITQQVDLLPEGVTVTFVRSFERKDNELTRKTIVRRRRLAVLSSDSEENIRQQSKSVGHDMNLIHAIDTGDSVVSFGAEAIVTAPNEKVLEQAVSAIKNYLAANDETRGLRYELDINKQSRPYILYGPNAAVGNKDVFVDMTSGDAALSALFVDSGGDRTLGSEYVGVSVGKWIRSHAAYNFQNGSALFVGNDAESKTFTLGGEIDEPSQVYLSKVASRAYLLAGQSVTHFVMNDPKTVGHLMKMPIYDERKVSVDVSKGLLNIIEAIDNGDIAENKERILSRFPTHINNIITLLGQFRDKTTVSTTDDFAQIARDILIDFFVINKYWSYDARHDLDSLRLLNVRHSHVKKLADFGQYVAQRRRSNKDHRLDGALFELDNIINRNILPTIPALDTTTNDVIDDLVRAQYRVVDLTGMTSGSMRNVANPSLNVMAISYLNLILPMLKNGDVIVMHGISVLSPIAKLIDDMIQSTGTNIDVIYTEQNQSAAVDMLNTHDNSLDLVMVDLYNNRIGKLVAPLSMDKDWSDALSTNKSTFFVKTSTGLDYIYLDAIL